jgi:hypothetical protein
MHNHSIALCTLLPILFPVGIDAIPYSRRIAAMGSIRAARTAGRSEAALAIKVSAATDPSITQGSRGDVPYKKLAMDGKPKVLWPNQLPCLSSGVFGVRAVVKWV